MGSDNAKEGDVIPADGNSVRLMEALSTIAKPFAESQIEVAKTNAELQVQMQREATKQLELRLTVASNADGRASWQEYSIVAFVLVVFAVLVGFGLYRDNMTLIGIGASGVVSFIGGLGLGRAKRPVN